MFTASGMQSIFSPPSPLRRNTGESNSSRSAFNTPGYGTSPPVPMAHTSGPQVMKTPTNETSTGFKDTPFISINFVRNVQCSTTFLCFYY